MCAICSEHFGQAGDYLNLFWPNNMAHKYNLNITRNVKKFLDSADRIGIRLHSIYKTDKNIIFKYTRMPFVQLLGEREKACLPILA